MKSATDMDSRAVVIAVFPGVLGLDVVGPLEVFALANRFGAAPAYATSVVSLTGGTIVASSGLALGTEPAASVTAPPDTLVVAGGYSSSQAAADRDFIGWLRRVAGSARRVTSVCSGALLLARAGLLDGRRATTHWSVCGKLATHYPSVEVETGPVYVRDGKVWTSAGVTAGMDLALALVEHDHGADLALTVARELVMFVHRPGGFPQLSVQLEVRRPESERLREILAFIARCPGADLSVPALARRCAMSVRTFGRVFRRQTGTTPGAFVRASRVEAARRLIQTSDATFEEIARTCGFGTVETMHRAFQRTVGTTPGRFRPQREPERAGTAVP
ncbi:GlxA family transcriptional regulator [Actinomadura sp. SCN-SB]|uniref:GlxA family transcriptional regulator n=1 Tax=Actinomadura sp. SCN-SB TaxID=3373092 RepID=UPI0037526718